MAHLSNCIAMMDEGIERMLEAIPQLPVEQARLCRLMLMVGGRMDEALDEKLKSQQLIDSEFLTLLILYSSPDGSSTPGELCEFTSQGSTNMTRIGNALVKRGLISRGASAEDRRRVVIRITAAGRRFVLKMLPPMFPRVEAMFAGFSATERSQLSRLLRKLAKNLDQLDAENAS
ncbi:MarR family transcriptional regulator [Rhodanobacter sp. DHG33]|uniref:MarR family winged helix-turn-helix transcriptional regulator n=1 Tax=Rhodanobacter sp. DHG33 TaxID=2775921 RepID=UPI0017842E1D|nr:MarR family transcriptional regulator [Rhodanobacter sp. DHG33]MBD8899824.1 MarR family transcriptional regulator [Rhodanobacter sp. DHG33]